MIDPKWQFRESKSRLIELGAFLHCQNSLSMTPKGANDLFTVRLLSISNSSFRSCPIQLCICRTMVLEANMANITQPNRTDKGNENYSFRCADAGFTGCSWEAKGSSLQPLEARITLPSY